MKAPLLLAAAFATLSACGKNFQATDTSFANQPNQRTQNPSKHPDIPVLQLFQQEFETVMLYCDVYAVDAPAVTATDKPVTTIEVQAFPVVNQGVTVAFESPSKNVTGTMTLTAPTLSSVDILAQDHISTQTPVVELSGQESFDLVDANDGIKISPLTGTLFTTDKNKLPVDNTTLQFKDGDKPTVFGTASISCYLEVKTLHKSEDSDF